MKMKMNENSPHVCWIESLGSISQLGLGKPQFNSPAQLATLYKLRLYTRPEPRIPNFEHGFEKKIDPNHTLRYFFMQPASPR